MKKHRGYIVVVVVAALLISITVAFVEKRTARATVPPLPGSQIRVIESYGLKPADTIGATIAKEIGAPENTFDFRAYSKKFPMGTFNEKRFRDANPDKYIFKEVNRREGIEVVVVFTNTPNINLAPFMTS